MLVPHVSVIGVFVLDCRICQSPLLARTRRDRSCRRRRSHRIGTSLMLPQVTVRKAFVLD